VSFTIKTKKQILFILSIVFFSLSTMTSKAERASVSFYNNESDGKLWVHIRNPDSEYRELIVYLPDKKIIYLVSWGQIIIPQLENFSQKIDFKMPIEDLTGIYFDDGNPISTRVFSQKGTYSFYFAGNVETEPENTAHDYIEVIYPPK